MNAPIRSADKAYYASKTPLVFKGTREGRKAPRPAPSYRHKPGDVTASSDKYYAELPQPGRSTVKPQAITQSKPDSTVELDLQLIHATKVLVGVVTAVQAGSTNIVIKGPPQDIVKAKAIVDMAVGRNTLTRKQADFVSYVTVLPPAIEQTTSEEQTTTPEPVIAVEPATDTEVTKKSTRKKTTRKKAAAKKETSGSSGTPEADDILNPQATANDEITEQDIANAFGVVPAAVEDTSDPDEDLDDDPVESTMTDDSVSFDDDSDD
jgi:DNA-binding transcriptional regulator YdaS (Cro superfamily)